MSSSDGSEMFEDEPEAEPRRKPGRPPKAAPPPGEPVPELTPSLRASDPENDEQRLVRLTKWRKDCPKIFGEAVLWCIEHCTEMGWEPRDLTIGIIDTRPAGGGEPVTMTPLIHLDQIQGTPEYPADEAALDWVTDYYHQDQGNSPHTYKGRIKGPSNSHIVETEPFRLESYANIVARRRVLRARLEREGKPLPLRPVYEPPVRPLPPPEAPAQIAPAAIPTAPPIAPPPPPPGVSKEEIAALVAQTVAAALAAAGIKPKSDSEAVAEAVAAALAAHGIKPKTDEEAQAERDAKLLASVASLIEARLGPTPVGAGAPPQQPQTMAEIIQDAARRKTQAEEEILQARKVLGVADPPPPQTEAVAQVVQDEDEGVFKQAFKTVVAGVANDPLGALGGLAAFAAPFLEGSAAGALIAKGAAGAAEAARQKQIRDAVQMPGTAPRKGPSV
jgi:hypothetical protein